MRLYHPTECIFDLLIACGPQSFPQLMAECHTQCNMPVSRGDVLEAALALEDAKVVTLATDTGMLTFELSDYGYELLAIANHRNKR